MIVVINSGSSSIKFAACEIGTTPETAADWLVRGKIEDFGSSARLQARDRHSVPLRSEKWLMEISTPRGHAAAVRQLLQWLKRQLPEHRLQAIAHRVVHGGTQFTHPLRVTPEVLAQLDLLSPLAPLHQPHNLAAIRDIAALDPELPQYACFDTAFHAEQEWSMKAYALPRQMRERGVRRYGFHGLSYEYIAGVLPEHLGAEAEGRVIVAHLGGGASLCALRERKSVATTMGFSALDGLIMGTRCGHIDPGVILYMLTAMNMDVHQIESVLYRDSGLLGVSEISSDMRELEASSDPRAKAAIELYLKQVARELGGMVALLGGLDALVFTAGIGEHSAAIRQRVCEDAAWLGVDIDPAANIASAGRISTATSRVSAWVLPTDEELVLARHAQALLSREAAR